MSISGYVKPLGAGAITALIVAVSSNLTGTLFEVLQDNWVLPAIFAAGIAAVTSTWTFKPLLLSLTLLLLVLCSAVAVLQQQQYLAAVAFAFTIAVLIGFFASALFKSSSSRGR
jgi:hypothetical protein